MTRAFVGLGSNIDPEENILRAFRLLLGRCRVVAVSTLYRTQAIPATPPPFINGVVEIETQLGPRDVKFGVLREVESRLGRLRSRDKNAPRTIDCDLLLHGDAVVREGDLVLPAPEVFERAFVARPLLELAPSLVLPGVGTALADVVAALPPHPMSPLDVLTSTLRRELEEARHGPRTRREARSGAPR
jgi:2-amino-4-hydroxy-6-hydroxymethyldihydropteridine diphosphokinase